MLIFTCYNKDYLAHFFSVNFRIVGMNFHSSSPDLTFPVSHLIVWRLQLNEILKFDLDIRGCVVLLGLGRFFFCFYYLITAFEHLGYLFGSIYIAA